MRRFFKIISITLAVLMISGLASVLFPASAAEGEGLTFEKEDMYVTVKDYDEAPNTFEAWVKLPRNTRTKENTILSNFGSGNRVVTFEIASKGNPHLKIVASETESVEWKFNEIDVCTGKWVHVAIVKNVAASTVNCYINGELKQSLPLGETNCDTIPAGGLCIGGNLKAGNAEFFSGNIREIAVFSSARTQAEITADMTSVTVSDGLLAHYDLSNHANGANIRDLSGNGYHAKYKNNTVWIDPSEKEDVTDYAYSFAVIGDTQKVNYNHPENFSTIYEWILDNIESKKIKHVFGLGDITDTSAAEEWDRAKTAIHSLDDKVSYSIVRGNHDTSISYIQAFPWNDYKNVLGGSFNNTMLNTYQTLTVGQVKYLFINLDFGPHDKVLEWAGELCEEYPDHKVIISTHAYLYLNGTPIDADDHCPPKDNGANNNGDDIWNKLVSKHENITLVLSGHEACDRIVTTQRKGDKGNTVTEMLINPQLLDLNSANGLGLVAMFYFSEDGNDVTVEYYSTIREQFYRGVNQFSFSLEPDEEELFLEDTTPEDSTAEETTVEETTTEQTTVTETTLEEFTSSEIIENNDEKSGCGASLFFTPVTIICVMIGLVFITPLTHKKEH